MKGNYIYSLEGPIPDRYLRPIRCQGAADNAEEMVLQEQEQAQEQMQELALVG
ncbi:hypothetical protein [Hydrogenophaga atypica]|uniref:Uncharacterized protein n=1 Tax=Hydrogenophaga atypica TaxID=249409 RepID=A0ABW2QMH2_9BURK